jgi:hypothetical protein
MALPLDRIRGSIPPLVPATPELEKRLDAVLARADFA